MKMGGDKSTCNTSLSIDEASVQIASYVNGSVHWASYDNSFQAAVLPLW